MDSPVNARKIPAPTTPEAALLAALQRINASLDAAEARLEERAAARGRPERRFYQAATKPRAPDEGRWL